MPLSIKYDSSYFDSKGKVKHDKFCGEMEKIVGVDYGNVSSSEKNRIKEILKEMRNSMKETCRKVKIDGVPISNIMIRYSHNPDDFPKIEEQLLKGDESEEEEEEEEAPVEEKKKPKKKSSAASGDIADLQKDIKEIKQMLEGEALSYTSYLYARLST